MARSVKSLRCTIPAAAPQQLDVAPIQRSALHNDCTRRNCSYSTAGVDVAEGVCLGNSIFTLACMGVSAMGVVAVEGC
jgi:hypothetical protein